MYGMKMHSTIDWTWTEKSLAVLEDRIGFVFVIKAATAPLQENVFSI